MYSYLLVMVLIGFAVFFSAACRLSSGGVTGTQATLTSAAGVLHTQLTLQAEQP
jgi:hypothetical protein